ncbi:hypothetical protein JCM19047_2533 [Bacillus sp. JCM 19047]|nr:hypothetical protein JCM19047_2533 [Bacillus sp. JCM 19047]
MKRLVISLLTIFVLSGCIRTLEGNTQKTLEQFLENGGRDVYSLDVDDEVQNQVAEVSSYELIELLEISEVQKILENIREKILRAVLLIQLFQLLKSFKRNS